ncbi:MAG: hypothetical protein Q9217_003335 [Psora testacea]
MASVQSAPSLPQGPAILPGNFSQEQAKETYAKFKQMQAQRIPENDPEFIKTRNTVFAIQRHMEAAKMKQANLQQQAQQQAQQRQQRQQQVQAQTNGVNGQAHHTTPLTQNAAHASPAASNATTETQSVDAVDRADGAGQKQNAMANVNLSEEHMNILKTQMMAFKMLSKNTPIPPAMQQQLFKSHQSKQPQTTAEKVAAASEVIKEVSRSASAVLMNAGDPWALQPGRRHLYDFTYSPFGYIRPSISYANHTERKNRYQLNSIMPQGVDVEEFRRNRQRTISARMMDRKMDLYTHRGLPSVDGDRLREERDRIAYNRIQTRKAELEGLPANLNVWDTSKSDRPIDDDSLKRKALIEYKMLCLLPKQRALRQQIHRDLVHYDNLAQTANRSIYRRQKKTSLREARITEKLEKQQRDQRENNEKKKQMEHLDAIIQHGREIQKAAEAQKQRQQKLGRLMLVQHQSIEKEEQKRVERTAKQRLQALKNDDEETYLKLLGQAKDSRISHLLKQTDGFLNQLAASVKQQQKGAIEQYRKDETPEDLSDSEDEEEGGPKVDYYQVAHRIKEDITKQPNLLVGGTLKEYQIKGLQWMISLFNNNLNGILADEMGLGKTIQTISLLTYLKEYKADKGGNGPFLVVVPLSTLTNWNVEFEKWAPSLRRIVYKGPPLARKQQQQQIRYGQFDVLLTTYEYIIKDRPVLARIKWIHMIIDEGHRMKNAGSKLSMTLTQYYTSRYRLILTGTPLQNNLPELWALLNFVLPNIFKSVKSFDEWFNTPFANTGGQDKMELTEEEQLLVIRRLHKVLRPFLLRRLKKDVEKDLPDKQERVIKCAFSALQAKIYKQLVTYNKISVSDGKGGKTGIRGLSNMLMQLRKLCNHPFVFEQVEDQMNPEKLSNDLLWRTAGKFELLDRVLPKFKASGHRVLMFFQMTQIMNIMEDFLRLKGLQYLRLDGSTKSDDRSELLGQFNDPNSPYFCFLLSTRAGGLGLNLQTADTVIIYDSDWNPHQDLQAQDRAHRIGQKNEVRILRLISSGSVEEKILERAQYKLDMDGKVIQAGRFDNKSTNEERDAMLRTLLDSAEAAEELANQEEMDDDDLNMIMARSEEEMSIFQAIDAERGRDATYGNGPGQLPRLLGEDELPDIYLQEDNPVTEEIEELAGRGARERTRVKYDDGLTEEQWLMAVDDDEDTIEDAIARKNANIDKRNYNKEKRAKKAAGLESSPEPSRDSSIAPTSKKRNRKSAGAKRKADEDMDDEPVAKKNKRGGARPPNKAVETLSSKDRTSLQTVLNKNFQALMDLEESVGEESRGLIDPFLKPVPRNIYPDYYMVIKDPICMDQVEKKINKKEYQSLKEYRDDIRLLCSNARTYNDDGSQLYQDANDIEAEAVRKLTEDTAEYPEWQDFDETTPADGRSTAAVSSAGTPFATGSGNGGTKLKLTFNGNREDFANGGLDEVSDDE